MNEEIEMDKPICIREVNENIRRVETGEPLTKSLKILNQFCEFRKKYEDMYGKCAEGSIMKTKIKFFNFKCKLCNKEIETSWGNKIYCDKCYRIHYKAKHREYMRKKLNIKPENYRVR